MRCVWLGFFPYSAWVEDIKQKISRKGRAYPTIPPVIVKIIAPEHSVCDQT